MKAIALAPQSVRSIVFALAGILAGAQFETAGAQPAQLGPQTARWCWYRAAAPVVPTPAACGVPLGMTSLGFNAKLNGSSIRGVADDFTVPASGWNLTRITVFAYQTDSPTDLDVDRPAAA